MKEHLKLLGLKVKDRVTGFEGIVTTIGFDLYGCVQAIVSPVVKDGKKEDSTWFDTKRLVATSLKPVMPVPAFEIVDGPETKPQMRQSPIRD